MCAASSNGSRTLQLRDVQVMRRKQMPNLSRNSLSPRLFASPARRIFRKFHPPVTKPAPKAKQGTESFRNLRGEVVCVSTKTCTPTAVLKPWTQLEISDVEVLSEKEVYLYEKELNLGYRRSLEERIARLEQLAQRTTLLSKSKGGADSDERLEEALAGMSTQLHSSTAKSGFDAHFLQVFLALPPEERRHATAGEIGNLERAARVQDGSALSVSERRARLKEKLWERRGAAPRAKGLLQAWAKPSATAA